MLDEAIRDPDGHIPRSLRRGTLSRLILKEDHVGELNEKMPLMFEDNRNQISGWQAGSMRLLRS
jgi:hypothetical protein